MGFIILVVLAAVAYGLALKRAANHQGTSRSWHSRPGHFGWYALGLAIGPAFLVWAAWQIFGESIVSGLVSSGLPPEIASLRPLDLNFFLSEASRLAHGQPTVGEATPEIVAAGEAYGRYLTVGAIAIWAVIAALFCAGLAMALNRIAPDTRARNTIERWLTTALLAAATISILTTIGIVFSVAYEALRFFQSVSVFEFLFGTSWSPQMAIRADQVGSSGAFGAVPLFTGTLLITTIAMLVAAPLGLLSAIYLSEYAPPWIRSVAKPVLEILAGVPTVVYGFFAALTVAPFVRGLGESLGLAVSSESALAAGVVMGIMIIPFISSLSDDAINAVPRSLRDASLGMGATRAETMRQVIFPAALPGIIAGLLLAISRAIGETMIVVMAAGLAANLTANPFAGVTTVTVQIATLLTGDQEFDSPKTLAAFALGLVLFIATLTLNVVALYVLNKYREKYD